MDLHHDVAKHLIDVFSVATVIGTLVNILPSAAAAFSIVWSLNRIYETKTVQALIHKWRVARKGD